MSDEPHIKLPKNGSRTQIFFGIVSAILFVANLYLSNGYVSKTTYESDTKESLQRRENLNTELRNIAIELKGIKDHMEGDSRQDQAIHDLEGRVRAMELKK